MGAPIILDHQNLYLALFMHGLLRSSSCLVCRKLSKSSDIQLLSRYSCFPQFCGGLGTQTLLNRASWHSQLSTIELVGVVSLNSCVVHPKVRDLHHRLKTKHKTQDTSNTSKTISWFPPRPCDQLQQSQQSPLLLGASVPSLPACSQDYTLA